ncbi:cytochrome P450 6k1-like [Rhodnius prolixus]
MELADVTLFLIAILITLIAYSFTTLLAYCAYWKNRRIAYLKPLPLFGNFLPVFCLKKSIGEVYMDAYFKFPKEKLVGVYETVFPVLVVRDPKIVEKIMVKDFQHFVDRSPFADSKGLFGYGLFQLKGTAWRSVRYKISPAFSSGKLKVMYNDMVNCTDDMIALIGKNLNTDYEVREAVALYAINVIANTVFGIQINNKSAIDEFIRMGTSIFNVTPFKFVENISLYLVPKFGDWLGFSFVTREATDYFRAVIANTLKQREKSKYQRNDYTQQLLKLKQQGALEVQSKDAEDDDLRVDGAAPSGNIEITDDLLVGQAFQFLSAGLDPMMVVTLSLIYDLALHPEIQERARQEVLKVVEKHNGYSYASLSDMTYVEQCIQETLRIHPIITFLIRECTKNYYLSEANLEVKKGQKVVIPIGALQMDPKYYPDPEVYNPERFPPNVSKQNFTYLPFGDGPRFCIGFRYAMIVMKLGLAKLLSKYNFKLSPKTEIPFELNKQSLLEVPKNPILFNITAI